jgi:hypothetical protein
MESSIFHKIGGFDTRLRSNEDIQFCTRARAIGIRVLAFPNLATIHLGAEKSLIHFMKRQYWHGSNVLSPSAFRGNVRAIGLAALTLACILGLLAAGLSGRPLLLLPPLGVMLLPPTLIALRGAGTRDRSTSIAPLILLLLTYALVRALVLPVAMFRSMQQWSLGQRWEWSAGTDSET